MEKLLLNFDWTTNSWFYTSLFFIGLSIYLFDVLKKTAKNRDFWKEQNNDLHVSILQKNPLLMKHEFTFYHLDVHLSEIEIISGINKSNDQKSVLIVNTELIFQKRVNDMKSFDEIKMFLMEMSTRFSVKRDFLKAGFFNHTDKKVRELTSLQFTHLKELDDQNKLKEFLNILEMYFSEYKDLHSTYFTSVNELVNKENVPA